MLEKYHFTPKSETSPYAYIIPLVVAGLMAKGVTEIYEPHYIDRGYENIEVKLRSLGAVISREKGD